jgi:hypothetical protein
MDEERIAQVLSEDRGEWDLLVAILDSHPDDILHSPESPPWVSRDVYAHLARWLDYSNSDMEAYCTGRLVSAPIDDIEGLNSKWHEADNRLSLAEARLKAQRAFAKRLTIVASVPLERWDDELDKIARYDGSAHLSMHRGYIQLKSGNNLK